MNRLERWFCSTEFWRKLTRKRILPWMLADCKLGDQVLEIGAGAGAATAELRKRTARLISLEYDPQLVLQLARRHGGNGTGILRGDAAALPFADESFSSVIAVLVLHHLPSRQAQDRAFAEIHRVLRPNGQFITFEVSEGWLQRLSHIKSTFVPLHPESAAARLKQAGFSQVAVKYERSGFRLTAE
jgi:ubiquinone/menaquinone biosynthesis C-methylase UbiE